MKRSLIFFHLWLGRVNRYQIKNDSHSFQYTGLINRLCTESRDYSVCENSRWVLGAGVISKLTQLNVYGWLLLRRTITGRCYGFSWAGEPSRVSHNDFFRIWFLFYTLKYFTGQPVAIALPRSRRNFLPHVMISSLVKLEKKIQYSRQYLVQPHTFGNYVCFCANYTNQQIDQLN